MQKQKLTFKLFSEITQLDFVFFGLPLVIAGALLPFASFNFFASFKAIHCLRFFWLLPGFVAARTAGMAFNQLIDARIDAKNGRTAHRPLPSGRINEKQVGAIAWSSLFAFLVICLCINPICLTLGSLAAFLIILYSYMKRIHFACHFVLGAIHLLGPITAAALISGHFSTPALCLGFLAFFSIAANDIIYAIQDRSFDIMAKLHSIPAKLGLQNALWIARIYHLGALFSFMLVARSAQFPLFCSFYFPVVGFIYLQFHRKLIVILKNNQPEQLPPLFKSCNTLVPLITLCFIIIGILWSTA